MTASGMSLLRSLAILEEQTAKPTLQKAIREVRRDIEGGAVAVGRDGQARQGLPAR